MNLLKRIPTFLKVDYKTKFQLGNNLHKQLSTKASTLSSESEKSVKKKKSPETKITLIGQDETVSIVDMIEAHKISARRDLKLVKIRDLDAKTKRPIYRLMTAEEYLEESKQQKTNKHEKEPKNSNSIKGDKLITISNKIGEHDMTTRIKNMKKLLNKHYEVRVIISNDNDNFNKTEELYDIIEKNLSMDGKIVQKRTKGNLMKFQIIPLPSKTNSQDGGTGEGNKYKEKPPPL